MVIEPSEMQMESFASMASAVDSRLKVPPVIFRSSLQVMPLPSAETTSREPVPFKVRSDLEKMTASRLASA